MICGGDTGSGSTVGTTIGGLGREGLGRGRAEVELVPRFRLHVREGHGRGAGGRDAGLHALDEAEEQEAGRDLRRLELFEPRGRRRFLQGAPPVQMLGQAARLALDLAQARHHLGGGAEDGVESVDVAQDEVAIGHAAHRRHHQPLRGQLEVDRALGQHAVLEVELAAGVGENVGEDALHLRARRFRQLALRHEAGIREDLRQRVAGADLPVDVRELLGRDLAALDQDRAELIARIVRGAEQDAAAAKVEGFVIRRAFHLQGAGGAPAVELDDEERKGLGVDLTADGERFGQSRLPATLNRALEGRQIGRNDNTMRLDLLT